MARINLLGWWNGRGLSRDMQMVRDVLSTNGHDVHISSSRTVAPVVAGVVRFKGSLVAAGMWRRILRKPARYDLNIFFETVFSQWLADARCNAFFPNPEWSWPWQRRAELRVDQVLCKTHDTARIYAGLGLPVAFVGFSGADRLDPRIPRANDWLHFAGMNHLKGTRFVIEAWARHPEWPSITIVGHRGIRKPERERARALSNVDLHLGHIADSELRRLQNTCRLHLCPSEAEGFGHSIAEALSCGAVVVSTDAPPMNELVTPDHGILVRTNASRPRNLGTRYAVDIIDMERKVEGLLASDDAELQAMGERARAWWERNDFDFRARLAAAVNALV